MRDLFYTRYDSFSVQSAIINDKRIVNELSMCASQLTEMNNTLHFKCATVYFSVNAGNINLMLSIIGK